MDRLLDRLEDCRRSFETAVILGGAGAKVAERLAGGRAGIKVRAACRGALSTPPARTSLDPYLLGLTRAGGGAC